MGYMHGEHCLLLDHEDRVIGHDSKLNCHLTDHESFRTPHRAFSVFLFNEKNELLLQRRASEKITFPLVWTNTTCSHPLWGLERDETIEKDALGVRRAAQRKLGHELGIPAEQLPLDGFSFLGRIHYQAPSDEKFGEHEIDYILFCKQKVDVSMNPEEVCEVKYVDQKSLSQLLSEADAGSCTISPWFRLIADNLLGDWWDKLRTGALDLSVVSSDGLQGILKFELGDIDPSTGRRPLP